MIWGLDDYVTKPFDHAELQAKIAAQFCGADTGPRRPSPDLVKSRLTPWRAFLTIGDKVINLRNRELRLLELLINAPGQIFPKQKLVDRLFSYEEDVSENAVEVYIGRLRKHLENSSLSITTHRGLGYRLDHD